MSFKAIEPDEATLEDKVDSPEKRARAQGSQSSIEVGFVCFFGVFF